MTYAQEVIAMAGNEQDRNALREYSRRNSWATRLYDTQGQTAMRAIPLLALLELSDGLLGQANCASTVPDVIDAFVSHLRAGTAFHFEGNPGSC